MTVVAEVLVQKVVAEVQNTGRIVTALQPVVIAGGGGAVDSVNGQTGVVVLDATDVGADPAGTAASAVAAHSADTTGVHGIADTAALVLTSDSRLSDARTPLAHVHSGSDITTGTVATARLNVGTTAGTVAAGDDSRFTDARTPTAHAATHTDGGTDEISIAGAQITTGTVATVRLGTGTADATTFLRGDQTWAVPAGGGVSTDPIFDVKGDLVVGTAPGTAARLGVGSDGQVLTADSGEAGGVKWAAAAVGGQRNRGYGSATWVGSSAASGATTSSANGMDLHTVGSASCWPVWLAAGGYDRIAVYVSTGGTATLRLGLSYSAADGGVGPPAWDAGTISVSSTGRVEISGSVTLPEGWYWTVVMCESYTATFSLYARSWTQNDIRNGIALEPTSFRQYGSVRHAGIPTGSLPDLSSYPVYGSLYGPIVALRRA